MYIYIPSTDITGTMVVFNKYLLGLIYNIVMGHIMIVFIKDVPAPTVHRFRMVT